MSNYGITRLSKLEELNADPNWVNEDLYRLLYRPELYVLAYERIKSSPGNMTAGTDGGTIDGFSVNKIEAIISSLRDESYQFDRARRVYIPKANGKLRPLGIPTAKDKVVQEVIRLILENIYDGSKPTFRDCSHGFRPGRGTHSCLKEIRSWQNVSWFIEGDIKACFDEVDHSELIKVLSKRISDGRFLDLIQKALNAGYMEGKTPVNSLSGTPQGSIVSPMLANVYLHELDLFVEQLKAKYEKGERKRINPAYTAIVKERNRIAKGKKDATIEERRALERRLRETPSLMHDDPTFIRIKYVRYADDWIIGIDGPKQLAEQLREDVKNFLADDLKLRLSVEKTHIRNARTERAFFLGTYVSVGKGQQMQQLVKWKDGREFRKRVNGWQTQMEAPIQRIIDRLSERGFCDKGGMPKARTAWTIHSLDQIVLQYNSVLWGFLNYYSFANNYSRLRLIQHILQQSALHTFGRKLQVRKPELYKRFGPSLRIEWKTKNGEEKSTSLKLETKWAARPLRFLEGEGPRDRVDTYMNLRTRSKLGAKCCVCGSPDDVEMHHLRHVRKGKSKGFSRVMSAINRKQIPVCPPCHQKIHRGEYDGLSLSDFTFPELAAM
ncbi:reverse transcriptase domain-containing protein [Paracidovorax wautersii]|uniref:Group II intron reverse transcriptase/maturase n=1 Tax=Paracidovorax wautersii TaxID=1177982 RepID=A0A1I2HAA6_9BURK|nr:reverse transcriptase domain-containing protein [Paracidovorax wautersii]SFF27114.1 group II intron reverse transcriptase/maturase [Paracidovorax wautersii]